MSAYRAGVMNYTVLIREMAVAAMSLLFTGAVLVLSVSVIGPWARAMLSGLHVPLRSLILMRFRRLRPHFIVEAFISLRTNGIPIQIRELEAIYTQNRTQVRGGDDLVRLVNDRLRPPSPET